MEEEERQRERQREKEERERAEAELRQHQEEMRTKRKREEEEELERLLLEVGDLEADNPSVDDMEAEAEAEAGDSPLVDDQISTLDRNLPAEVPTSLSTGVDGTDISSQSKKTEFPVKSEVLPKSNIEFKNFQDLNLIKNGSQEEKGPKLQLEEPVNVWSSLRHLKQSSNQQYETIFSSKAESTDEKVSLTDIDDMIQNLAKKIAEKRLQDLEKPDLAIIEEDQEEEADLKDKESTDIFVESDRCLGMLLKNILS